MNIVCNYLTPYRTNQEPWIVRTCWLMFCFAIVSGKHYSIKSFYSINLLITNAERDHAIWGVPNHEHVALPFAQPTIKKLNAFHLPRYHHLGQAMMVYCQPFRATLVYHKRNMSMDSVDCWHVNKADAGTHADAVIAMGVVLKHFKDWTRTLNPYFEPVLFRSFLFPFVIYESISPQPLQFLMVFSSPPLWKISTGNYVQRHMYSFSWNKMFVLVWF